MDYCNIDSEVIESLDYLRPPVKRIKYPKKDKLHNSYSNDIKLLKSYKRKITQYENSYTNKPGSSTSLVLQKSSERSVLEKYSIISYTDIQRSNEIPISNNKCHQRNIKPKTKPLIKVTVTPKTEDPQVKLLRKRRQVVNRIQTSVSNQESSIQIKNISLVISGRRKEKIYELKTTESAKFSNDHSDLVSKHDELYVRELPNFKHIIKSLNMDKKKKKNRKKREKGEAIANNQLQEVGDAVEYYYQPNARNEFRTDLGSHKSRVTIYGRVGITEDDRYVMDCSATLNSKPVTAENYGQVERSRLLGSNIKEQTFNTPARIAGNKIDFQNNNNQRNTFVQADFPDDVTCYKLMDRSPMRSKESQSTQVDFSLYLSHNADNAMKSSQKKDEMVQCKCNDIKQFDDKAENKKLKKSHSPFVIISVYPKADASEVAKLPVKSNAEDIPIRRVQQRNREMNTGVNVKGRAIIKKENEVKATTPRFPRPSRSSSPTRKSDSKKIEPKSGKPPLNQTTVRRATSPTERAQQNNVTQKTIAKKFKPETTTQVYRQQTKKVSLKSFEDKGTNTEHLEVKKALVDQYTKQIAGQIRNSTRYAHKSDSGSKDTSTTIDDFENNVVYRLKDQNQTGRKLTDSPPRYYKNEIGSLDNYLLIADNASQGVTPSSETFKDWPIDDLPSKSQTSRIHVRDSLEISHRRGGSAGQNIRNTQTSYDARNASNDSKYLAPIKHYTGDKCAVPNPVARDKEIRELLGVNKGRVTPPNKQKKQFLETLHAHAQTHPNPVNCYYQETSEKNIYTGFHILKCPCQCCQPLQNNTMQPKKYPPTELEGIKSPQEKSNAIQAAPSEPLQQERTSLYQQMILNRNIQVFLQVEQFTKQKPIVLSRRQYDKVKKTIEETISKTQHKKKKSVHKGSIVSVGEVRKKSKHDKGCKCSKEAQTVIREAPECVSGYRDCCKVISVIPEPQPKQDLCFPSSSTNSTNTTEPLQVIHKSNKKKAKDKKKSSKSKNELNCVCPAPVSNKNEDKSVVRQAVSSMEIRYTSISYLKHVTFSSTNVESTSIPLSCTRNDSSSLYTIFKGHRKSPTPNLGTSAFSLYSEVNPDTKILKILMPPREPKPKKPFLKKLMSCLVMRSTRASEIRTCIAPAPLDASANSSIDSYHFSTSLGQPVEISSSLYDTSASFYSSHSIHPITSKMKRGFFSSVRGFLNRKS